ncbi:MAG: ATP-binding protein [Planctomycetota bacterium JB042]
MIARERHLETVLRLLRQSPVVALLGARQVGKTTLAREIVRRWKQPTLHLDLERSSDLARLSDPQLALERRKGLVVLDEVQRKPDVFETLRVLADRPRKPSRFLVLGSASPHLLRQSAESLAGRIAYHELPGFLVDEVGPANLDRLWLRGGFPRAYTARTEDASRRWRDDFLRTFLERELPDLGLRTPPEALRRFWSMLAHWHGQVWNASELGRSLGANDKTAHRYLDILCATYMVRTLRPWHENLRKRQVRSPKVYLTDTGLLHRLLGIRDRHDLDGHPKVGASWEGFLVQQVIGRLGARPEECHFWKAHAGPELDLLVVRGRRRLGFEFKRTAAPEVTRSMHLAMEALGWKKLTVVHAGPESFPLARNVDALAADRLTRDLAPLR